MKSILPRIAPILAIAALIGMVHGLAAAQETATEAPPVVVPEDYLDALKAKEGDEEAFVEQLWAMGDLEFTRIEELRAKIASRAIAPSEIPNAQREIYLASNKLVALGQYGTQRYDHNAHVRNFYGNVLYDVMGKQEEGVKEWLTAVSLDSKYSDPYNNLGMHYFHIGRYPLGYQNMDKALELDPKSPDYCYNMAQNYLIFRPQTEEYRGWSTKRVYKEAMKLSKKAVKLAPDDYEILQDYAVNFLAAENFNLKVDWKDSIKAWEAARKHAPSTIEQFYTWLNEGRAWRRLENKDEALRCFKEALALQPNSEVTQRLISELEAGN